MEQLFVTFERQSHSERDSTGKLNQIEDEPLGYAARYDPTNEKNNKKNNDQLKWVRCIRKVGDIYHRFEYDSLTRTAIDTGPFKYQPIIVDNEPINGFTIVDFVSRSSTQNKLIRIRDPRGFKLEISVANLLELLGQCTVINGTFNTRCIWDFGKNGIGKAKLVIVCC